MTGQRGSMEVEVKARAGNLAEVRQRLHDRGAERVDERREADVYLAHPQRDFAETDEALRVRRTDEEVKLTYKGPRVDETTKTREEIDLAVGDAGKAEDVMAALGFDPAGRVVKHREVYELDGMTVVLDQVDGLGCFVEVETVVHEDVDEAREAVLGLAEQLGLDDRERRSYLELILEEEDEAGEAADA